MATTTTNLLWAHLLRKDAATASESTSQIPPIAPQDKTATSMRMLIHDTQVNLEKFSARLDGLLRHVDDCRVQVVNANKLLDVERDKVLTEILEITNKCQAEMRAHVGTPAQAPALELVRVSQVSTERSVQAVDKRIDALQTLFLALEKRIDALQALLQTHAHAMQSAQDQQSTLIGAQMDQIKMTLSDTVAKAVSTITAHVDNVQSTIVAEYVRGHACVGSWTLAGSLGRSMSRPRHVPSSGSIRGPRELGGPTSSPLDNSTTRLSLKRTFIEGATHQAGDDRLSRRLSCLAVPRTGPNDSPPVLRTPRTPRQPLADLVLPLGSNTPRSHGTFPGRYIRPREAVLSSSDIPTSMSRPPPQIHPDMEDQTISRRSPAVDQSAMELPSAIAPSDSNAFSRAIKMEEIWKPDLTGVFSIQSSPLSTPPSSMPPETRHDLIESTTDMASTQLREDLALDSRVGLVQVAPSSSDPMSSHPDVSPARPMSLRDRRAQISRLGRAETRRFIPLVPWSDDEE